ncbi:MAG: ABC transporter permease [Eubacterium sp.]|nr:ABC transporter permease [Eubacterium sp.]
MTVFKAFFKVLRNYKVSFIIYMSISIGVVFILSGLGEGSDKNYSAVSHGLIVVDNDDSEVSRELVTFLDGVNEIKKGDFTDDQIIDLLYYTKISNYLVIPQGFGDAFLSGNMDTTNMIDSTKDAGSRMGYLVEAEIESFLNLFRNYIIGGYSTSEAAGFAREAIMDHSSVEMADDGKEKSATIFIVFIVLPYGLLSMLFSAILPVILRFNTEEINKRTGISSLPNIKKQTYISLATAVSSLMVLTALIVTGSVISKEAFTERWWLVLIDLVTLGLTVVMLIVALSNFNIKPSFVAGLTNIIGLSFCFLGGIFVPLEYLGNGAKTIGRFLPTYWYAEAIEKIKQGGGLMDISNCLLIQLMFGIMVMAIGLAIGKYNVKKAE